MAVLYNIPATTVAKGPVLTNQDVTPPLGTPAISYDVTVGDITNLIATEDFDAWVEYDDGTGVWREISRFHAGTGCESVGRVAVRGVAMRLSASCNQRTAVSVLAQTSL
jgi:hypothetical protein